MTTRVLLTGISGFIAKHVALQLLEAGYAVRGTVRSMDRAAGVETTLARVGADTRRLEFALADLTDDTGWDAAAADCSYVIHTASPFPATQANDKFALVPIARGGTLRVLEAARRAGVRRTILTSSVVAVYYGHEDRADPTFSEADWSKIDGPAISDYAVSKTQAERAAWDFVRSNGMELTTINPSFVQGPLLDAQAGTSARLTKMMMTGKMPAVPDIAFGIVDVRDVARAHVLAMTNGQAAGRRFLVSGGTRTMRAIAAAVGEAEPVVKGALPRFTLPDVVLRLVALVSNEARSAVPELGRRKRLDTGPAQDVLGLVFRSPEEAIGAMATSLRTVGLVP